MRKFDTLLITLLALAGLLLPQHAGAQGKPFITRWHVDEEVRLPLPFNNGGKKEELEITYYKQGSSQKKKKKLTRSWNMDRDYELIFDEGPGDYIIAVPAEELNNLYYKDDRYYLIEKSKNSLIEIVQWGDMVWMGDVRIVDYKNLNIAPEAGAPTFSNERRPKVIMFDGCESLNVPLEDWDITGVERISLAGCKSFNQPLEKWDVSKLTDMSTILNGCTAFDQPLGAWHFTIWGHDSIYFPKEKKWYKRTYARIGLNNCGMSQKNYEATLAAWAPRHKNEFIRVDANGLKCECKNEARQKLVNEQNWLFVDDEECITISTTYHEIAIGGYLPLDVAYHPNLTPEERNRLRDFPHYWESSNPAVATVLEDHGVVEGKSEGDVTISFEKWKWRASHKMRVISVNVDSVSIDKTEATIGTSGSLQLNATVYPENANNKTVLWLGDTLFNLDNNGLIRPKRKGEGNVYAVSLNGKKSKYCKITVVQDPTEVQLSQHELTIDLGGKPAMLTATVLPEDAADKSITWSAEPSDVVSVSAEGAVTPLKSGKARVIATAHNGVKDECAVTVNEFVSVSEVVVAPKSMTMSLGDAPVQLTATVKPDNATIKTVTWVTEPADIVKVENGAVTPLKAGEAKVIALSHNKLSGECTVTVNDPANPSAPKKTAVEVLPGVEVAPNPFDATLTVLRAEGVQRYELVDASGAIVASGSNQANTLTIATAQLPQGVYVLRLMGAQGERSVRVVKR